MTKRTYARFQSGTKHIKKDSETDGTVETSNSAETFTDAGWLIPDGVMAVDIDELPMQAIHELINTFKLTTETHWTTRGAHLFFTKQDNFSRKEGVCALGFKCEYKYSTPGKPFYITVRTGGQTRKMENIDVFAPFPAILDAKRGKRAYQDLVGMNDGDGRNNALKSHSGRVHALNNWRKVLTFVNNHVFGEPLSDAELQRIIDDAKEMPVDQEATEEYQVATEMIEKYNVKSYAGSVYYRDSKGDYINDVDYLRRAVMAYRPGKATRFTDEVIKQMQYRCEKIPENAVFDIKLTNGVLHRGKFMAVDFDDFTPYSIHQAYDPKCPPVKDVDDYLNFLTLGDPDYRAHVLEVLGYCLVTEPRTIRTISKFFVFYGEGGNGKGTLLTILRTILEADNVVPLDLDKINDERYTSDLPDSLAILGDDVTDAPIKPEKMKMLKNISTADFIQTRRLYHDSEKFVPICTMIFTSNHILKSWEKGDAFQRRIEWLPMNKKPDVIDPQFLAKQTTPAALAYWFSLMVQGYERLCENQKFTESEIVKKSTADYFDLNDNTREFVRDNLTDEELEGTKVKVISDIYNQWCEENEFKPLSSKTLKESIKKLRGFEERVKKINKICTRVFYRPEEKKVS